MNETLGNDTAHTISIPIVAWDYFLQYHEI